MNIINGLYIPFNPVYPQWDPVAAAETKKIKYIDFNVFHKNMLKCKMW